MEKAKQIELVSVYPAVTEMLPQDTNVRGNMDEKVKDIITKHLDSDKVIESVSMTMDFKTHNKEMKKLNKLMLSISHDVELCKTCIHR